MTDGGRSFGSDLSPASGHWIRLALEAFGRLEASVEGTAAQGEEEALPGKRREAGGSKQTASRRRKRRLQLGGPTAARRSGIRC